MELSPLTRSCGAKLNSPVLLERSNCSPLVTPSNLSSRFVLTLRLSSSLPKWVNDPEIGRASWGKSVSVRVDLGGRRIIKKKKDTERTTRGRHIDIKNK